MRDAACVEEQGARSSGRSVVEQHLRRGILLVKIWQEVLKVKFAGDKKDLFGRLDEFKREMWLLLVAAGSGYLARCWHKTLNPSEHSQLSDHAYEDPDERPGSPNYSSPHHIDSSPNGMRYASHGHNVSPRLQGRSFASKGLSRKLFADGGQGPPRNPQRDKEPESSRGPDDTKRFIGGGNEGTRTESKRSPWSTFKAKKKQGSSDDDDRESSAGCLQRTGEKFRWVRERRKSSSDNASSSSRSLQGLLDGEETPASGAGSSSREFTSASQSQSQSVDLDNPPTRLIVVNAGAGKDGTPPPKPPESQPPRVAVRDKISMFEQVKEGASSNSQVPPDGKRTNSFASNDEASSSGAKEEKGSLSLKAETVNAVLSLRAANLAHAQAQAQAQALEREKFRNLKLDHTSSSSRKDDDALSGSKGKRRTDVGRVPGHMDAAVLPAFLSGKRTKETNKPMARESSEITLASLTGKGMKEKEQALEDPDNQAESSLASAFGPIDLTQVFFGFDSMFFGTPKDDRSPVKGSRRSKYMGKSGNRNLRRMRESPKPISALESALRAQQAREESPYMARALSFRSYVRGGERSPLFGQSDDSPSPSPSSKVGEFDERKINTPDFEDGLETDELKGVIGLPALRTPRKKGFAYPKEALSYKGGLELVVAESNFPRSVISEETERVYPSQSKLNDVVWRRISLPVSLKKRKVSQAVTPSSVSADTAKNNAYEFEALVIPPMEGLLFSFGVGIGVMSTLESSESEIERLGRLLRESEERIEHLNELLSESRQITADFGGLSSQQLLLAGSMSGDGRMFVEVGHKPPRNVLALVPVKDESGRERSDLLRKEAPETPQQIEHMAELEAELEAQLGLLTAGMSEDYNGTPDYEELDPEGIAGVADRDLVVDGLPAVLDWDDDNDDFIPADLPSHSGGGVPPRELARLLRKVQSSRQEHRISELETDLMEAEERLQKLEKELLELKESIGSSAPPSAGDTTKDSDLAAEESESGMVLNDIGSLELQPELGGNQVPEIEEEGALLESDAALEAKKLVSDQLSPTLPERSSPSSRLAPSSSLRGSVKILMLSEESTETAAQAANDAVCDEFLSSVFGITVEGDKLVGGDQEEEDDEDLDSPEFNVSVIEMPLSPAGSDKSKDSSAFSNSLSISYAADPSSRLPEIPAVTSGEDLDQVVGELLRRDSSSVKNAIKEFLLWERAEADESNPKQDETLDDEAAAQMYSRSAPGKYSTPQKSVISTRLEQLARSTFNNEKLPVLERSAEAPLLPLGTAKLDDKTMKLFGLRDREASVAIKDRHQPPSVRREAAKAEASKVNVAKEGGSRLASADLSAVDSDFQSLLEKRRELRYASSKVGLSLGGAPPAPERDPGTYYRYREDPSRAGNNSPIQKSSHKNLFHSPHTKNTRISLETQNNRLYQNPMSDWLAEVGSPPSEGS